MPSFTMFYFKNIKLVHMKISQLFNRAHFMFCSHFYFFFFFLNKCQLKRY